MRFIIVGSGWRSLFYVRIAKNLPEHFELSALLCRSQEKAEKISNEENLHTTTSIEECVNLKPDFVVVTVNKASIFNVSLDWLKRGFKVLCETPVVFSKEKLLELKELPENLKSNLFVAEQYKYFATNQAILKILQKNLIGEPSFVNISLTNDHHAASLIREFLQEKTETECKIKKKIFSFPTREFMNRYERFTDGRIGEKKRGLFLFEFADGKTAAYDFDSEQYRSPIRNSFIKIQGPTGEIFNEKVTWLDSNTQVHEGKIVVTNETVTSEYKNPNLHQFEKIQKIVFEMEGKSETLYENPFPKARLNEDETAIAELMLKITDASEEFQKTNLENAIRDAEMALE